MGSIQDDWKNWRHITKLDPDRPNPPELISKVVNSGTDAVMVSGTQGITREKVKALLKMLRGKGIPVVIEPANKDAVVFDAGVDYVFIPSVLNSNSKWWVIDVHVEWIVDQLKRGGEILWGKVLPEAYIVLNPDSAVARLTESRTDLSVEEILGYVKLADSFLRFPIVYIEYSGRYGDPEVVRMARSHIGNARLFYGGGIDSREKALEMAKYATIVVGNIVYRDVGSFLETVI
ncbi:MAG: heptaprenylglyceryl phosphate synthase [Candidatus Bathyarchaeia archaeon]|nr:heptaprenylglyceryl phosphate synthase [Candidatus Bathyarchaeota archaeon]